MGMMKNIYIDICNANDGKLPGEITAGDVRKMKEIEIYNWKDYQNYLKKELSTYTQDELKLIQEVKKVEKQKEKEPF